MDQWCMGFVVRTLVYIGWAGGGWEIGTGWGGSGVWPEPES